MRKTAESEGYGKYVEPTLKLIKRLEKRIDEAQQSEGWNTYKTARLDYAE